MHGNSPMDLIEAINATFQWTLKNGGTIRSRIKNRAWEILID